MKIIIKFFIGNILYYYIFFYLVPLRNWGLLSIYLIHATIKNSISYNFTNINSSLIFPAIILSNNNSATYLNNSSTPLPVLAETSKYFSAPSLSAIALACSFVTCRLYQNKLYQILF